MSTETKEQRIERIVDRFRADPELQELVRKDLTALCEEMEREKEEQSDKSIDQIAEESAEKWQRLKSPHSLKEAFVSAIMTFREQHGDDAKRLDWLEANPLKITHCTWINVNLGRLWDFRQDGSGMLGDLRQTLREAIDKAMLPQPPAT